MQTKDRYIHAAETAKSILADFRQVEENFRELERNLMEQIIIWKKGKGELLEKFFADREFIQNSEQGRSFMAFWDYLMSKSSYEELDEVLGRILSLQGLGEIEQQYDMRHIRRQWSEAAQQVMDTISNLSRQISQYVDKGNLEQERYVYQLIKDIEDKAVSIKGNIPRNGDFAEIDRLSPDLDFMMDRRLFVPPKKPVIDSSNLTTGDHTGSVDALFKQVYVDKKVLAANIESFFQDRDKVPLSEVLEKFPLTKGVTELLSYLVIASGDSRNFVEGERQQLAMENVQAKDIKVEMDKIVFHKQEG